MTTGSHNLARGLRFEQVSFTYPGRDGARGPRRQLARCEPGESLALVGENGSGKTTLIKLLTRLYDADAGRILLDGTNLERVAAESRCVDASA